MQVVRRVVIVALVGIVSLMAAPSVVAPAAAHCRADGRCFKPAGAVPCRAPGLATERHSALQPDRAGARGSPGFGVDDDVD